jgi:hypothetical protein
VKGIAHPGVLEKLANIKLDQFHTHKGPRTDQYSDPLSEAQWFGLTYLPPAGERGDQTATTKMQQIGGNWVNVPVVPDNFGRYVIRAGAGPKIAQLYFYKPTTASGEAQRLLGNDWHHIAIERNFDGEIRFYINGDIQTYTDHEGKEVASYFVNKDTFRPYTFSGYNIGGIGTEMSGRGQYGDGRHKGAADQFYKTDEGSWSKFDIAEFTITKK